ncbi:MAG: Mur ligase family protein [Sphingobacteriales bacterium JAD_PAG50586_3]|nr:MAG: Mur ligase family protein [Sphingobacteriales bacterium JAD_PAG50586_3]
MKIHFIAIGGSAMHNLAIALKEAGNDITGSDDEIFEPSRSRLARLGLLPEQEGWYPEKIHTGLDCVVLGMHARKDNPELLRATELGIKIFSYPEYLYEHSKHKTRVVIGGSHGKTTITAMVMHILHAAGKDFDYMVGAQLKGFDTMVRMTNDAPIMILEGDEYLTSPIDPRPKFHLYKPHVSIISGIAWDHINVFPTFSIYLDQFRQFINLIEPDGTLIYFDGDENLKQLSAEARYDIKTVSYNTMPNKVEKGITYVAETDGSFAPLRIIGKHNLQNLAGALEVCRALHISDDEFFTHIQTFEGAAKRLEPLKIEEGYSVFRDFAHAPSKLKATVSAVKEHFHDRTVIACFELHTFSSLNKEFLQEYAGAMDAADIAIVYFSNHALELKRLEQLSLDDVKEAFTRPDLEVYNNATELYTRLQSIPKTDVCLLLMSSGNFDGLDLMAL